MVFRNLKDVLNLNSSDFIHPSVHLCNFPSVSEGNALTYIPPPPPGQTGAVGWGRGVVGPLLMSSWLMTRSQVEENLL